MLQLVTTKFIPPNKEEIPAKCKEKITISMAPLLCPILFDKGGYKVHPVPPPPSIILDTKIHINDIGSSQKDKLFMRGNDISGALSIIGNSQFPKPPIKIGMTIKKIINKACEVTI